MSEVRLEGAKLYLTAMLGDGSLNVSRTKVFVELRDEANALIKAKFEIPHVLNGKYQESTEVMTSDSKLTVDFFITELDGVTPSVLYDPNHVTEVYLKDVVGATVIDNLDKKISAIVDYSPEVIVAEISSDLIELEFTTDEVIEIEIENNETIEGVVYEC